MYTCRKMLQMWLRRFLLREASSQLPASSGVKAPVSVQAGLRGQPSRGGTDPCSPGWGLAWFSGSLSAVPGFAGQPAALGLAGPSGTRGLLGGVLGSSRMFLLDFFAIVCMQ